MVIHGWTIYLHGCFEAQLTDLLEAARDVARRRPHDYLKSNAFKRLAAVTTLAFDQIPTNPSDPKYRQGDTLGKAHTHWFRAKFFQQYRLFFRFNEQEKAIIFAWVNDEDTLRAYGSRTDAYLTFKKMLANGHPPDDWSTLKSTVIQSAHGEALRTELEDIQKG